MANGALTLLEELRGDAKLGKNKHFNASERKLKYHFYCGVPVVLINVFIGTVIIFLLSARGDSWWVSLVAAVLAFAAASLSALQTLFNFHKVSEGHRAIGNRYLNVSRRCKKTLQMHQDRAYDIDALWAVVGEIESEYKEINSEAESFPTNLKDLAVAKKAKEITPFANPFGENSLKKS